MGFEKRGGNNRDGGFKPYGGKDYGPAGFPGNVQGIGGRIDNFDPCSISPGFGQVISGQVSGSADGTSTADNGNRQTPTANEAAVNDNRWDR